MTHARKKCILSHKAIFVAFVLTIIALMALYMYFLSMTVVQVVMRKEVDHQIQNVRSDVSDLETKYIASQHKVSEDIASLQGYTQVSSKVFIDRSPTRSVALSTNTLR